MWNTAGEARMNSQVTFSYGPLYMDVPVFAGEQLCVDTGCSLEDDRDGWGETESGKPMLSAWLNAHEYLKYSM